MINVKLRLMIVNALNAILIIFARNHLMEILMENAYVKKDITMIILIIYANNVLIFGNLIKNIFNC